MYAVQTTERFGLILPIGFTGLAPCIQQSFAGLSICNINEPREQAMSD